MTADGHGSTGRSRAAGTDDFTRAFQALVSEVFRLNGQLLASADRLAADLGVSPARWQVIATLRKRALTVPEIAGRLGLTRQSVQRTVNLLVSDGLAELRDNPRHRRSRLVALTPAGQRTMAALRRRQVLLSARFAGGQGLGADDLRRLAAQLRRLREQGRAADEG